MDKPPQKLTKKTQKFHKQNLWTFALNNLKYGHYVHYLQVCCDTYFFLERLRNAISQFMSSRRLSPPISGFIRFLGILFFMLDNFVRQRRQCQVLSGRGDGGRDSLFYTVQNVQMRTGRGDGRRACFGSAGRVVPILNLHDLGVGSSGRRLQATRPPLPIAMDKC